MSPEKCFAFFIIVSVTVCWTRAAPQIARQGPFGSSRGEDESPQPYEFHYNVDNPQTATLFGQNESSDQQGRVTGGYYVLLPDGRIMNVEYTVEGESGFVPRITFSPQNAPGAVPGRR
ncbi:uncharacterized protein LOC132699730 [Cylas formicarius]|uniref:uncharacterized protein LOC132699730 n=1 Tax=Cylas formicarius TaxID=197179 RepID=UPI0029584F3F|nr:uncharacterized protein LOC132699730 [Cylas formicarius]